MAVLHRFYCILLIFQAREKEYEDSIAQSGEAVVSITGSAIFLTLQKKKMRLFSCLHA